jgi:hypothetical protein
LPKAGLAWDVALDPEAHDAPWLAQDMMSHARRAKRGCNPLFTLLAPRYIRLKMLRSPSRFAFGKRQMGAAFSRDFS